MNALRSIPNPRCHTRLGWFPGRRGVEPGPPDQTPSISPAGSAKTVVIKIKNLSGARHAYISRADGEHGDPRPVYEKMGSPIYPTQAQLQKLREPADVVAPEVTGAERRRV